MRTILAALVLAICWASMAAAQTPNYAGRKAIILDVCPHLRLTSFRFENRTLRDSFVSYIYKFQNTGQQPIIAEEIVTLRYDPFDRPQPALRLTVPGTNITFTPIAPGGEGGSGYDDRIGDFDTFTAVAYVRAVRLADGTVWRATDAAVKAALQQAAPQFTELGPLAPEKAPEK